MKVLIDIPKGIYEMFLSGDYPKFYACDVADILRNGTPLPKGHGRIGDFDALIKQMDALTKTWRDNDAMWYAAVVETAINEVAQVLIEADGGAE